MSVEKNKTEVVAEKTQERKLTPHDLVKADDVQKALLSEMGPQAVMESFKIEDFTAKGDNYACVVSSVRVTYKKDNDVQETSYVVKLNPCRGQVGMGAMSEVMFSKETGFYVEILPKLNLELQKIGISPLKLPRYYHSVTGKEQEVIYLEDMRRHNFRMCDRKKGMDDKHVILILKELGKLHAGSVIWMSKDEFIDVDILKKYPVLTEAFDEMMPEVTMDDMFASYLDKSAFIAEKNEGYGYVGDYLRSIKKDVSAEFKRMLEVSDFKVICHGDCWNNNFLFKYDENNIPVDCRLVDLQITRVASPALDLNYMLYCSMSGDIRKNNLENFFAHYYSSFASVMAAARKPSIFTLEQFKEEFYSKNLFGLMMGMMLIPIVLMDSEDAPSFDDFEGEDIVEVMEQFQNAVMEVTLRSPLLTPRFLSMFDEMKVNGLFDKSITIEK